MLLANSGRVRRVPVWRRIAPVGMVATAVGANPEVANSIV